MTRVEELNAEVRLREQAKVAAMAAHAPVTSSPADDKRRIERHAAELVHDRAEAVLNLYGKSAPFRDDGESILQYRLRLANELKPNSSKARFEISRTIDAASLAPIEQQIYADAEANRWHPVDLKPGQMREVVRLDARGQAIHEFVSGRGSRGLFQQVFAHCIAQPMGSGIAINGVPAKIPSFMG